MGKTKLLIAGASVRAAVGSAQRSSAYQLWAADLFNDQDLCRACASWRLDSRYTTLAELAARVRPDFWMYTGALENHPTVLAAVSRHARLLGNDADTVRRIRRPTHFAQALAARGLPCPDVRSNVCPPQGSWLCKPHRSAAGIGIRLAAPGEVTEASDVYFERLVLGNPCSAVFVACRGTAQLLGSTQQLSGDASFGASGFRYCGSIGPLPLTVEIEQQWQHIGNCLASTFQLKGLFGVDAINNHGQVIPIEVNPRYPASVEVLETDQAWSSIDLHVAACCHDRLADVPHQTVSGYAGKAIVFARRRSIVTGDFVQWIGRLNDSCDRRCVADIPQVDTTIDAGQPIVTVFAYGDEFNAVLPSLRQLATDVNAKL